MSARYGGFFVPLQQFTKQNSGHLQKPVLKKTGLIADFSSFVSIFAQKLYDDERESIHDAG